MRAARADERLLVAILLPARCGSGRPRCCATRGRDFGGRSIALSRCAFESPNAQRQALKNPFAPLPFHSENAVSSQRAARLSPFARSASVITGDRRNQTTEALWQSRTDSECNELHRNALLR